MIEDRRQVAERIAELVRRLAALIEWTRMPDEPFPDDDVELGEFMGETAVMLLAGGVPGEMAYRTSTEVTDEFGGTRPGRVRRMPGDHRVSGISALVVITGSTTQTASCRGTRPHPRAAVAHQARGLGGYSHARPGHLYRDHPPAG